MIAFWTCTAFPIITTISKASMAFSFPLACCVFTQMPNTLCTFFSENFYIWTLLIFLHKHKEKITHNFITLEQIRKEKAKLSSSLLSSIFNWKSYCKGFGCSILFSLYLYRYMSMHYICSSIHIYLWKWKFYVTSLCTF